MIVVGFKDASQHCHRIVGEQGPDLQKSMVDGGFGPVLPVKSDSNSPPLVTAAGIHASTQTQVHTSIGKRGGQNQSFPNSPAPFNSTPQLGRTLLMFYPSAGITVFFFVAFVGYRKCLLGRNAY